MKNFFYSRDGASKGAALLIALALVVLLTGLALAYFSRTTTDRQLAQSSHNDTSADLLARSALDIVVNDFKQEIISNQPITFAHIQPVPYTPPPQVSGSPIPNLIRQSFSGDPTGRTSNVNSGTASANGRFISLARWNSHYLIPRANTSNVDNTIDSTPVGLNQSQYSSFTAPNWVLVTPQGSAQAPAPNAVIGRYAFAVYDEGGLLDMSLAGYPSWSICNTPTPTPTPWLVNVGRKGIVAFADLTALPWPSASPSPSTRIDNIVGWRNYAMTQRASGSFGNFSYAGETDCTKQDWYGSYLLDFGDPPFSITSLSDKLLASTYPFTAVPNYMYPAPASGVNPPPPRTDQSVTNRQELLRLILSLGSSSTGYNQNVLQYMGTFSRERNRPAPDWSPDLQGALSEGRFNLNNLALVIPNPAQCIIAHGKKTGWRTGKNKNKLCGDSEDVHQLFGLFFVTARTLDDIGHTSLKEPGYWVYIGNNDPLPDATATPAPQIGCLKGANLQNDFFQILNFALSPVASRQKCAATLGKTFAVGASLIDQYDSGASCLDQHWGQNPPSQDAGCDLDKGVANPQWATHTTVIKYKGGGNEKFAYGMEKDWVNGDGINGGDLKFNDSNNFPHRPCDSSGNKGGLCHSGATPAPTPKSGGGSTATVVMNHAFSNVGEFGYGMNTSDPANPTATLDFSSPSFPDAAVLDFFSYNPISSAYPRAGIVNLYTRNAPVLAAMLSSTWRTEADSANPNPAASPAGRVSPSQAMDAANRIVQETQNLLAGTPGYGPVTQTDLTRAIAARLVAAGAAAPSWSSFKPEEKESIARALAEMGQTRTWNLFIDVIAQTGKYAPDATDVTQANKFGVEGEKRYWLHIALGRDLIQADGTPCAPGVSTGCQVDVLGTQLEEVTE